MKKKSRQVSKTYSLGDKSPRNVYSWFVQEACVTQTKGGQSVIWLHEAQVTRTRVCSVFGRSFFSILCSQNTLLRQPLAPSRFKMLQMYGRPLNLLPPPPPPGTFLTVPWDRGTKSVMYFTQRVNPIHGQSRWQFVAFLRFLAGFVYLFVNSITAR